MALLEQNQRYDDAANQLTQTIEEYQKLLGNLRQDYNQQLETAKIGEATKSWTVVAVALQRAAELDPSAGLETRIQNWIQLRDSTVPRQIEDWLAKRNLDSAEKALNQYAKEIPPPNPQILGRLQTNLDSLRKEVLETRLNELVAQKKYYTALQLIKDSQRIYLDQRLPEVRSAGCAYYKTKANEEKAAGILRIGYAFFAAEKAWQLNPDDSEAFALRRELSDVMNDGITHQIGVALFSSPVKEPEAGLGFANSLNEYLFNNVPYGIQLLERQQFEALLKENRLDKTSALAKVKMLILGDVTILNIERQRSEGQGIAKIEIGRTRKPNPLYIEYLKKYGRDKKRWPEELTRTEPEIEDLQYGTVTYKKGEEILNGGMEVSVRTVENSGKVISARVFKQTVEKKGIFSDSVPQATPVPIEGHTLQMPADNEVKKELHTSLAKQVGEHVLDSFRNRETRFFESVQTALDRREFPRAVTDLAGGYFYCCTDKKYVPKPEANETYLKIRQLGLFDLTE